MPEPLCVFHRGNRIPSKFRLADQLDRLEPLRLRFRRVASLNQAEGTISTEDIERFVLTDSVERVMEELCLCPSRPYQQTAEKIETRQWDMKRRSKEETESVKATGNSS